ncbi:MAG: response regulator transcription factor [Aphanocapsa lilacina HA4352-LM1]|jgi:DNA-binding NarL/FixJ family response regulator|nr:response regulator transcription factor [Aphanocapsa lilacina HA4352-LM1]
MIRLLVVDDQPLFRQGLSALLALEADLQIVGEAEHGAQAVSLAQGLQPDVVLMDVRMPVCDGVSATQQILGQFPWMRILVLTTFDEDEYVWQSLQAGALGYLLKNTPSAQMVAAVRAVHQGHGQLGPTIAPKVFSSVRPAAIWPGPADVGLLNERDLAILKLLATGLNNREIARALHLAEGTIKNHLTQILSQLGLRDRTQAALWAQRYLE